MWVERNPTELAAIERQAAARRRRNYWLVVAAFFVLGVVIAGRQWYQQSPEERGDALYRLVIFPACVSIMAATALIIRNRAIDRRHRAKTFLCVRCDRTFGGSSWETTQESCTCGSMARPLSAYRWVEPES